MNSPVSFRKEHVQRIGLLLLLIFGAAYWWFRPRLLNPQSPDAGQVNVLNSEEPSLQTSSNQFMLENKPLRILSGAMHYFRVVPEYWNDRLLKMKACGLNTVETYVPWNLHEEVKGTFNFQGRLDIVAFIKEAKNVGLYVIVRPGPYICAEWEFGGLPSWLLKEKEVKVRSMCPNFIPHVDVYFDQLIPRIVPLQYNRGGPVIAVQVENEFGSFGSDPEYMTYIKEAMTKRGITELLVTSDGAKTAVQGSAPEALMTVNFQSNPQESLNGLRAIQENKPLMVMEYWSGWFDHWGEKHHVFSDKGLEIKLKEIFEFESVSINFYMFHGGTNFGFMNGANYDKDNDRTLPTITSYDYDAPISEDGELTSKYFVIKDLLNQYTDSAIKVELPVAFGKMSYGKVDMKEYIPLNQFLEFNEGPIKIKDVLPMEKLPTKNSLGQGYGFTLYRNMLTNNAKKLKFVEPIKDRAQIFIDDHLVKVIDSWKAEEEMTFSDVLQVKEDSILDILVENQGRINFGDKIIGERKGLSGDILLDDTKLENWHVFPLEFKEDFMKKVSDSKKWQSAPLEPYYLPALYRGYLELTGSPKDTFLKMEGWEKGVMFINGFNIGRYWKIGPQKTYYVPGPILNSGKNEIIIFEQSMSAASIEFTDKHNLGIELQHVKSDIN